MGRDNYNETRRNTASTPSTSPNKKVQPGRMKEEISLELADLAYQKPKHEPMTPNQREKSEKEKH